MAQTAYWIVETADDWVSDPAITGAQIEAGNLADNTAAFKSGSETGFDTTGEVTITEATAETLTAGTAYKVAWTVYDSDLAEYATPVVGDYTTAYELTASTGEITFTGQASALAVSRALSASPGEITFTGQSSTLVVSRVLTTSPGEITFTGHASELTKAANNALTTSPGEITFSGQPSTLTVSRVLTTSPGEVTFTGQSSVLNKGVVLTAAPGEVAFTGQASALTASRLLSTSSGQITFVGQPSTLTVSRVLTTDPGQVTFAGQASALTKGQVLSTIPGQVTFTGQASQLTVSRLLTTAPNQIVFSGAAASLSRTTSGTAGFTLDTYLESTPFGDVTVGDALRIILAAVAGKLDIVNGAVTIRDMSDSKDRIRATVDSLGNRTSINHLDGGN